MTWAAPPGPALPCGGGSKGMEVRLVKFWLRLAADNYSGLSHVTVDGSYGPATVRRCGVPEPVLAGGGRCDRAQLLEQIKEVALAVAAKFVDYGVAPGQFTATVRQGSSGTPCGPCSSTCGGWRPTTAMCPP